MGDIVFGDQTTITIGVGAQPASAAAAASVDELRSSIEAVSTELASIGAQLGDRDDLKDGVDNAGRELARAKDALAEGKRDRTLQKLEAARAALAKLGPNVPAAVPLSETVAVLTQRARSAV